MKATRRTAVWLVGAAITVTAAAGCNKSPTGPSEYFTDGFTDTLRPGGGAYYTYTIVQPGDVEARVISLDPDASMVGVGLGTAAAPGACALTLQDDSMQVGDVLKTYLGTGRGCIQVYDPGTAGAPVSYVVEVYHP